MISEDECKLEDTERKKKKINLPDIIINNSNRSRGSKESKKNENNNNLNIIDLTNKSPVKRKSNPSPNSSQSFRKQGNKSDSPNNNEMTPFFKERRSAL